MGLEWLLVLGALFFLSQNKRAAAPAGAGAGAGATPPAAKGPDPLNEWAPYQGSVAPAKEDDDQRTAAYELAIYLARGGKDHGPIAHYQQRMGQIRADGVLGPETRARARELGVTL